MAKRQKKGAQRLFDEKMRSVAFADAYREARAEIDATDKIMRQLDAARVRAQMSKADLARAIGVAPEYVRKLFTASKQNPTAITLTKMAEAVGYELKLVRKSAKAA
jgi:DNA-binding phage protein